MFFDHHIHSKYSIRDSRSEIKDIIEVAKASGLGGIAISDHDNLEGSLKASKLSSKELVVIPSIEVSSLDGHIIALGVRKPVERDMSALDTVDKIHALGGIAIAAHPYDSFRRGVGDLSYMLEFDAIEINGHCLHGNGHTESVAKEHSKPLTGGSDAHSLSGIGAIVTEVQGKNAKEIIGNIKKGKCKAIQRKNDAILKTEIIIDKIKYRMSKRS